MILQIEKYICSKWQIILIFICLFESGKEGTIAQQTPARETDKETCGKLNQLFV